MCVDELDEHPRTTCSNNKLLQALHIVHVHVNYNNNYTLIISIVTKITNVGIITIVII